MSPELQTAVGTIVAVVIMRIWSMFEHRKTGKQINEIYFVLNGEVQKKIEEAREEGRQEILKQNQEK